MPSGAPAGGRLLAGDAAVLIFFFALSLSAFLKLGSTGGKGATVEVEVSGRRVLTIDRREAGLYTVEGPLGHTQVEIRGGEARIVSSPCPLKLCRRAGWIGSAGGMVVCLPNEVVVRLPGTPGRGIDAVSR
ncbi:NusG domain II-containing protein [Candidatus Moduliflexota bacterium]